MLYEVCRECQNFFETKKVFGVFKIQNGVLSPSDFLKEGQFFRIVGSTFNDGVFNDACGIVDPAMNIPQDEIFDGAVWAMAVPPAFIALTDEIKAYNASDAGKASPFVSESFGGYSYTKATDASGTPIGWQKAYASRLNKWRKVR